MKRKLWVMLALAALIALLCCGAALAEYAFTSFDRESPVLFPDADGVYRGDVSWEVNFTPTAIKIYRIDGVAYTTTELVQDLPVTATSTTLEAGYRYNLFIYYGNTNTMNERVYQEFLIAKGSPSVSVRQTFYPSFLDPSEKAAFAWTLNFTPTRIEIRNADTEAVIAELPGTATSWDQFDRSIHYQIRFYHNNSHVDKTVSIQESGWAFVTQPAGGNIVPEGSIRLSWSTNFTPEKVVIGHTKITYSLTSYTTEYIPDATITTNLGKSMFYDIPYSFADSSKYTVQAYYEDAYGAYVESDEFSITKTSRSFTKQPDGGNIFPGGSRRVSWSTNFTPEKVVIGHTKITYSLTSYTTEYIPDATITTNLGRTMSFDIPYGFTESSKYTIHAYYIDAYGAYIESNEFSITKDDRQFTTTPTGGTINPAGSLSLKWTTNFLPVQVEIGYKTGDAWNNVVTLTKNIQLTMSYLLPYNSAHETMYIRAWYDDEHYVESLAISIEIVPRQFTLQPTGGTVYPWTTHQLRWTTNFYPTKIQIGYRESRTGTWVSKVEITTGLNRTMSYKLSYDEAFNGTMYVHAFYGSETGEWVPSEPISMVKQAAYACGDNLTAVFADGTLTISGSGAMYDYSFSSLPPWYGIKSSITNVVIADGVTSIGEYGLYNCINMYSITIPTSVTYIGNYAFYMCSALRNVSYSGFKSQWNAIDIDGGNTNLLNAGISYLQPTGTISHSGISWGIYHGDTLEIDGWGDIPDQTNWYQYGPYIQIVKIYEGVTGIGTEAFRDFTLLTEIQLPQSLTHIDGRAFTDCKKLKDVYYDGLESTWQTMVNNGDISSSDNAPLFNATLHTGNESGSVGSLDWTLNSAGLLTIFYDEDEHMDPLDEEDMVIRDMSSESAQPWYAHRDKIRDIQFDVNLTYIGDYAFAGLNKLSTVELPGNLTELGDHVFENCWSLEHVTFPIGMTKIGTYAFYACGWLIEIELPAQITEIGAYAFYESYAVRTIRIPAALCNIGDYAFYDVGDNDGGNLYYGGTSAQWKNINIGTGNQALTKNMNIHFTPEELAISEANFPDAEFRGYVSTNIDADQSGWLTDEEIYAVTNFGTEDTDYTTVQGIEYFTEMTFLMLDGAPSLTSIDLSANTKLTHVEVFDNALTELNLSGLAELQKLSCDGNSLTSLDVSAFDMRELFCYNNPMTSLNLGSQSDLQQLFCFGTNLDTLDLRSCPLLLDCVYNGTKTVTANYVEYKVDNSHALRVSSATELILPGMIQIDAAHFPDEAFRNLIADNFDTNGTGWLTSAEIAAVTGISFEDHDFTTVQGIEYFTELQTICIADADSLNSIDLRANTKLTDIDLSHNGLTEINLDGLTEVKNLYIYHNCLQALDVSMLTALERLECDNNPLTSLILGGLPHLSQLYCYGTNLTSLDISGTPCLITAWLGTKDSSHAEHDWYTADECALEVDKGLSIITGLPAPAFTLPAALTTIEAEAFSGIAAEAVLIPAGMTSITGDPFSGSSVRYIYGSTDLVRNFAEANGYIFVPVRD